MTAAYTAKSRKGPKLPNAKFPAVTTRRHNEISPCSSQGHILMQRKPVPGLGTWSGRKTHPFSTCNKVHVQRKQSPLHLYKTLLDQPQKSQQKKLWIFFCLLQILKRNWFKTFISKGLNQQLQFWDGKSFPAQIIWGKRLGLARFLPHSTTEALAMPVGLHSQCGVRLICHFRDAWALFYPQLLYYQTGTAVFYLLFAVARDGYMWWKTALWDS